MKHFGSKTQKIGELGEKIACGFLVSKGFTILERNYTKKIGEIDIIAKKDTILHFVEVKTLIYYVSHETNKNVSRETSPFDNFTHQKLKKFSKTIQWYLKDRRVSHETKWVIDVVAVTVTRETRSAKVEVMWNIVK